MYLDSLFKLLLFLLLGLASSSIAQNSTGLYFDGQQQANIFHHQDFNLGSKDFSLLLHFQVASNSHKPMYLLSKSDDHQDGLSIAIHPKQATLNLQIGTQNYPISIYHDQVYAPVKLLITRQAGQLQVQLNEQVWKLGRHQSSITSKANWTLGQHTTLEQGFKGLISRLMLWEGAISNWPLGNSQNVKTLIDYHFAEGQGQFVHDFAQLKHHAYLGSSFQQDSHDPNWSPLTTIWQQPTPAIQLNKTKPLAYQYVLCNSPVKGEKHQWFLNETAIGEGSELRYAFPPGHNLLHVLITNQQGQQQMYTKVLQIQQYAKECVAPNPSSPKSTTAEPSNRQAQLLDRFGQVKTTAPLAKVSTEKGSSTSRTNVAGYPAGQVCQCGMFTLYFQDVMADTDVGFDDPAAAQGSGFSTLGEERRAVICRVYEDLTLLIGNNPTTANLGVEDLRVEVQASDGTGGLLLPNNAAGVGSSYFFEFTSPSIHKFARGEMAKTILAGRDSYEAWLTYDPNLALEPHGATQFNFANFSFNSDLANLSTGNHLYLVGLHEAMHGLGFASLIGGNTGPSYFASSGAPNIYSHWDRFLQSNQQPLINSTVSNGVETLSFTPNTVNTCGSTPNDLSLNGVPSNSQHPVYYTGSYAQGSSFSHFNCTNQSGYAMNFSATNISLHPLEVEALCLLGYTISGTYGQNLSASNQSNTLVTYSTCSPSGCQPIAFVDNEDPNNLGNSFQVDRTGTLNEVTISFADLLSNDVVPAGTTVEGLQIIKGGGTITTTATDFTYEPDLGFGLNWAILSYAPRCANGTLGEQTYIYIWVPASAYPACDNNSSCNLICNGDFEAFMPHYGSTHPQIENFYARYAKRIVNVPQSTDIIDYTALTPLDFNVLRNIFNSASTNNNCSGNISSIPTPMDYPTKKKYLGLSHRINASNSGSSEALYLTLKSALIPSPTQTDNYKISFWVYSLCDNFDVRFVFSDGAPCPRGASQNSTLQCDLRADNVPTYLPPWNNLGQTVAACPSWGDQTHHHNQVIPVSNPTTGTPTWTYVEQDFYVTKNNLQHLIVHLDALNPNSGAYSFFDNFSIERIDAPKINISSQIVGSTCPGGTPSIQYTIEGDVSIPTAAPLTNVQLDVNLPQGIPANLAFATGGDFTNGQATIPVLNAGDIVTLNLPLTISSNANVGSSNLVTINAIATGACVSSSSGQQSNIIIADPSSRLTLSNAITSTGPYPNGSTVQHEITISNIGNSSINNIQLDIPALTGLVWSNIPAPFNLAAGASQTFTINGLVQTCNTLQTAAVCAGVSSADEVCNLPTPSCLAPLTLGGATSGSGNFLEVEDPTHTTPSWVTATATGTGNQVVHTGLFLAPIDFKSNGTTTSLSPTAACPNSIQPFLIQYGNCGLDWVVEVPACLSFDIRYTPDVAIGQNGDVYLSFSFEGSFTWNGTTYTSQGGADIAIFKYNSSGQLIWVQTEGGLGDDVAASIDVYNNGSNEQVFITGSLLNSPSNSVTFNTSTGAVVLNYSSSNQICTNTSYAAGTIFLSAYTDNGTTVSNDWVQSINSPNAIAGKLAVAPNGQIYLAGYTGATFTFNGQTIGAGTYNDGAPDFNTCDLDLFILKYTPTGAPLWAELYGSAGVDLSYYEGSGFEFDVACTNNTDLAILLPARPNPVTSTAQPYMQHFGTHLLQLNATNGAVNWTRAMASPATTTNSGQGNLVYRCQLEMIGNAYVVAGSFILEDPTAPLSTGLGSIDFYGNSVSYTNMSSYNNPSAPNVDAYQGTFLQRFDMMGNHQGIDINTTPVVYPPENDQFATMTYTDLVVDNAGQLYAPFYLRGTTTLNGNNLVGGVVGNQDVADGFVQQLDPMTLVSTPVVPTPLATAKLHILPNPNNGQFLVQLEGASQQGIESLQVLNTAGQLIYQRSFDQRTSSYAIQLDDLPTGVYIIQVHTGQQFISKRLVIHQ